MKTAGLDDIEKQKKNDSSWKGMNSLGIVEADDNDTENAEKMVCMRYVCDMYAVGAVGARMIFDTFPSLHLHIPVHYGIHT